MSFTRRKENFICDRCGARVTGTGYTNHCPACLWSKHVDVHPGDRSSPCGGAMEPVSVGVISGVEKIVHRCTLCGFVRPQEAARDDNREELTFLSGNPVVNVRTKPKDKRTSRW